MLLCHSTKAKWHRTRASFDRKTFELISSFFTASAKSVQLAKERRVERVSAKKVHESDYPKENMWLFALSLSRIHLATLLLLKSACVLLTFRFLNEILFSRPSYSNSCRLSCSNWVKPCVWLHGRLLKHAPYLCITASVSAPLECEKVLCACVPARVSGPVAPMQNSYSQAREHPQHASMYGRLVLVIWIDLEAYDGLDRDALKMISRSRALICSFLFGS